MFSLLRAALVIGAIFYFSPVRHGSDGALSLDALIGAANRTAAPERLEAAWNALPEGAKQVVLDKITPAPNSRTIEARRLPQTDTLLPDDHRPAWSGAVKKPGA